MQARFKMSQTRHGSRPPAVMLTVREPTGCDRADEPVTSGVPWPRGALAKTDGLALCDRRGRRLPLQARPIAFWPDGSVKWTLLTARLDARGGADTAFRLEVRRGAGMASDMNRARGLRLVRGRDSILIDTGVLRLSVDTKRGGFVTAACARSAEGRWRPLLQPSGMTLYANRRGPDGGPIRRYTNGPDTARDRRTRPLPPAGFRDYSKDPPYSVSVVEEGPERVGLRIEGTHVDAHGNRFCHYVVRLYAYRGSARVDIQHTLVYTGLPRQDLVAGFGIEIPLKLAESGRRYTFSEEQGPGIETLVQPTPDHPRWLHGRLIQTTSIGYVMEKRTSPDRGPVKIAEGGRNQGWAGLSDGRAGCMAAVRDYWQQYPKSFEVDAERCLLRVGLWPSDAAPWDLRRYSLDWHPALYEYSRPDLWKEFPEDTHGARGISKTHDLSLWFHADEPDDGEPARTALACNRPLMLMADPAWYCGSGALGPISPADPRRFPGPERTVTGYIDYMLAERERNKWYGMCDYGDMQMTYAAEDYNRPRDPDDTRRHRWLFDVGGHAWINTEARPDQGLWLTFFRTGRPDIFEAASAMTRHNRDLEFYHWGNFKGSGSRHNVNHWGCLDKEWRISNPISMRWHYYMTGDGWTLDSIRQAVARYQSDRDRETSTGASGGAILCGLLVKSEITGAAEDLAALRNIADLYASAVLPNGSFADRMRLDCLTGKGSAVGEKDIENHSFFMLGFGCMQTLVEVAELLDHAGLSEALTRYARARFETPDFTGRPANLAAMHSGRVSGSRPGKPGAKSYSLLHVVPFAHAWRRTRDPLFLRAIRGLLTPLKPQLSPRGGGNGCLAAPRHLAPVVGRKQTCWMLGDIGVQTAFGLAAMASEPARPR